MANAVRYDPANYRGVYDSLARSTNLFSAAPARAAVDFFKGEAAGIKKEDDPGIPHKVAAHRGVRRNQEK